MTVFVAGIVVEHALESSLNPARHQISEYVNTPTGGVMVTAFVGWALSLAALAALVWRSGRSVPLVGLLAIASAGVVLTVACPTQTTAGALPPGVELTMIGRLHDIGSGTTSSALFVAAFVSLRAGPREFQRRAALLISLAVIGSVVFLTIGRDVGGARQRLVVGVACTWQALLLRRAAPPPLDQLQLGDQDGPP